MNKRFGSKFQEVDWVWSHMWRSLKHAMAETQQYKYIGSSNNNVHSIFLNWYSGTNCAFSYFRVFTCWKEIKNCKLTCQIAEHSKLKIMSQILIKTYHN